MNTVKDGLGVEIKQGQLVKVHQRNGVMAATVVKPLPDCPTRMNEGHWVEIDFGGGPEGMPSYILEVVEEVL